jgi:hypothetical protein
MTMRLRYAIAASFLLLTIPISLKAQTVIPGQTLYGTVDWDSSMNPILVTGDITVDDGATLNIGPGCDIRFQENSDDTHWGWDITRSEIIVYGTLNVNGTASELVVLTSTGTCGTGWFGIIFSGNSASGAIQYANIDHSVFGINFTALDTGSVTTAANCLIHDVSEGMYFDNSSSPAVTDCTVINAVTAFSCWGWDTAPAITNCNTFGLMVEARAVYATEGTQPVFTGCAFSSGSVELDWSADVVLNDTTVAETFNGIIGHEYREFTGFKFPSDCSLTINNCNIIGTGDQGNGIEWDDNLDMLKVEYSRIGGFLRNVFPRWGSIDPLADIRHMIGPRFIDPYYGICTDGDGFFLVDSSVNFYSVGARIGMPVYNDTDGSFGTVVDIISVPSLPVTFNTLQTSGMSSGYNNAGDIYHFIPLADYNNIDMGDLGGPNPYRYWPPGHVPSVGENEFYGVQAPPPVVNFELEASSPKPPDLYQLEVWAEGCWWVTDNDQVINRYILDYEENENLGKVHYTPHRTPDEKRTYSISGTIEDSLGDPVEGVRVSTDISVQFPGHTVLAATTNDEGYYTIYGLLPSATSYTVVPQKLGYTFTPPSRTVTIDPANPSDVTDQDFIAVLPAPVITGASREDGADGGDYGLPGRTNWGIAGETTAIVVTGIHFREKPALFLRGPLPSSDDTACSCVTFVSSTKLTATVSAGMEVGDYAVKVVNPDGQEHVWGDAATPGFTIVPPPPPQVFNISPNPINNRYSGTLSITGRDFIVGCSVSIDGSTWSSLTPEDADGTTLLVSYQPLAISVGTWPVIVTNPGGQTSNDNVTLSVIGAVPTPTPTVTPTPPPTSTPTQTPTQTPIPKYPRIQPLTDADSYVRGDVISLSVEMWPDSRDVFNNVGDLYIAVRTPGGSLLFLSNGRWQKSATALYKDLVIGAHSLIPLGAFGVGQSFPTGVYTLYGVLTVSGKSVFNPANWRSGLGSSSFTVSAY